MMGGNGDGVHHLMRKKNLYTWAISARRISSFLAASLVTLLILFLNSSTWEDNAFSLII